MPETNKLSVAEAALALVEGKRLTRKGWDDGEYLELRADGLVRVSPSSIYPSTRWTSMTLDGEWLEVPKRDMGADPKPGDVCDAPGNRCLRRVVAVTDNNVFVERDGVGWVFWRDSWAGYFADGTFIPVEYADD